MKRFNRQKGITLVEILVTVVILSVGLLALAKIQLIASAGTNSAGQRNQAVLIADNIFENMRANREAAIDGKYNISLNETVKNGNSMAQSDIYNWKQDLKTLINGAGSIQVNNGWATVIVQWEDNSNSRESANSKQQIKISSQL